MRTEPDFVYWADTVTDRQELATNLETAYKMGYAAGRVDESLKWWEQQNEENSEKES